MKTIITLVAGTLLWAGTAVAEPSALVRTEPANGATNVPAGVGLLRFHFDQNMDPTDWSFCASDRGSFPPQAGANSAPWRDSRCAELRVAALEPGTTYAVQLNSAARKGFHSAQGNEPLPVAVLVFTTQGKPRLPVAAGEVKPSAAAPTTAQAPVTAAPKPSTRKGRNPLGAEAAASAPVASPAERPAPAKKARNPLGAEAAAERQADPANRSKGGRPACPQGWADFKNPIIGMEACVPADYWVRLRGGLMLTVEKQDSPATMAFMVPMRLRAGAKAGAIAERFAKLAAQAEPRFQARTVGEPSANLARSRFSTFVGGQPVEGKYCTVVAAGGSMAYVIGISAPQGRLEREQPKLEQIAQGFGFTPARGKWINYRSPAGGFTLTMPEGWLVESGDGRSNKDDIDWGVRDPQRPLSRAFQWCPRFCSPQLLQDPLHAMRGYQAGEFQSPQQVITASLAQIAQNPKLLKASINQELTRLFQGLNQQTSQLMAAMNLARSDITLYDCLAQAQIDGQPVTVGFLAAINTLVIGGGFQPLTDLRVTLRGWCAEPGRFVNDTPVLEKVCASMQLSPEFLQKIVKGDQQAANKIRETYDYMNKVDDQIRQNHWDTMDAIAEMNYDTLREHGGYVNEKTGRIEQIPPESVVKNSRGERVSLEEVRRGVNADSATVLRDAYSNDYMSGVYGRTSFSY